MIIGFSQQLASVLLLLTLFVCPFPSSLPYLLRPPPISPFHDLGRNGIAERTVLVEPNDLMGQIKPHEPFWDILLQELAHTLMYINRFLDS